MTQSNPPATARHWLEFLAVRAVTAVLGRVPLGTLPFVGRCLGRAAMLVLRRNVRVAHSNLKLAYGDKLSHLERTQLIAGVFNNLGLMVMELSRLSVEHPSLQAARTDLSGAKDMLDWAQAGKPLLLLTLHYGNWEVLGPALSEQCRLAVMARPLDNPLLEVMMTDIRTQTGHSVVNKRGGLRDALRHIRESQITGWVIDQDAGRHGTWAPLFGVTASTPPTPIQIALKYNLPIFVIAGRRCEDNVHHEGFTEGPIWLENTGDVDKDVRVGLARVNQVFENIIEEQPDQWFGWIHRRWKSRPPSGESIYDADGTPLPGPQL